MTYGSLARWLGLAAITAVLAMQSLVMADEKKVAVQLGKIEEADAMSALAEPNFGYIGTLGAFQAMAKQGAEGMIAVHDYPDTSKVALAETNLTYVGPKRLGNVDGWVFKTEWDGEQYPSKIFFSAQEVYFGGGVSAYIAADYRQGSGWVWKLHPLRRLSIKN